MEKLGKLTKGEIGVYWAVADRKKGYSKITKELKQFLVVAFNDHPHVVVSGSVSWFQEAQRMRGKHGDQLNAF
jgi:hypothetical protein